MRVAIRTITTIEGDPLEQIALVDAANASHWIRILAGPEGEAGEESFDLNVCTPPWLQAEVARSGPIVGRHLLIVERWDAETVVRSLRQLFMAVEADDWSAVAQRLGRIGYWEFEDYQT